LTIIPGLSQKTLRGGAWNNNQRNARVSSRNRNQPDNFNNNIGFRVVAAPNFYVAGKAGRYGGQRGPKR
jgi:hypothetical protein